MELLQDYTFVLRHKVRIENKVADALSRRVILIAMSAEVTVFERLREEYESCPDFEEIYVTGWICSRDGQIVVQDEYLLRFRRLCIPRTSIRDSLLGSACRRSSWTLRLE